ncbi:MAG: ATP synthase F0 subunit B [Candidatus Puniceispirillales bacterium WSBS_2018_MAG_OTU23]
MAAEYTPLINEGVWVAASFAVFVGLVWKKAGAALSAMFDKRADAIKTALEEARALRDEAQAELTKYQRLSREASEQAEQITANAMLMADSIRENAATTAMATIKRKEDQATAKIKAIEAEVIAELRGRAAGLGMAAAADIIKEKLDDAAQVKLVQSDLKNIKNLKKI